MMRSWNKRHVRRDLQCMKKSLAFSSGSWEGGTERSKIEKFVMKQGLEVLGEDDHIKISILNVLGRN